MMLAWMKRWPDGTREWGCSWLVVIIVVIIVIAIWWKV